MAPPLERRHSEDARREMTRVPSLGSAHANTTTSASSSSLFANPDKAPLRLRLTCLLAVVFFVALALWLHMGPPSTPSTLPAAVQSFSFSASNPPPSKAKITPRVCSHRLTPFPSGGLSAFDSMRAFVKAGVRCFDLDLFQTQDGVVHVGVPHELLPAIGLRNATALKTTMEVLTAQQLRQVDVAHYAPTLEELLDFLASDPFPTPAVPTVVPSATKVPSSEFAAPLPAAAATPPIPLDPIFVTLEPKPFPMRTQARLELMLASVLRRPSLVKTVAFVVHSPSVAQAIRATKSAPADATNLNLATDLPSKPLTTVQQLRHRRANEPRFTRSLLALPLLDRIVEHAPVHHVKATSRDVSSPLDTSVISPTGAPTAAVAEEVCGADFETYPIDRRLALLDPYDIVLASYRLVHSCGSITTFSCGNALKHEEALDTYLQRPALRSPERNPLVQSVLESEAQWFAHQLEKAEAAAALAMPLTDASDASRTAAQKKAALSSSSRPNLLRSGSNPAAPIRPHKKRLAVWNVDSSSLLAQLGQTVATRSWSSLPHSALSQHASEREIHSNAPRSDPSPDATLAAAVSRARRAAAASPSSSAQESESPHEIPFAFFVSNVPHDLERWIAAAGK